MSKTKGMIVSTLVGWGLLLNIYMQIPILYHISIAILWTVMTLTSFIGMMVFFITIVAEDNNIIDSIDGSKWVQSFAVLNTIIFVSSLFYMGHIWATTLYIVNVVLLVVIILLPKYLKRGGGVDGYI